MSLKPGSALWGLFGACEAELRAQLFTAATVIDRWSGLMDDVVHVCTEVFLLLGVFLLRR